MPAVLQPTASAAALQPTASAAALQPTASAAALQPAASAAALAPASKGSFWQGQDGNVWVAGARGTHSAGAYNGDTNNYWTGQGYKSIANPNPSTQTSAQTAQTTPSTNTTPTIVTPPTPTLSQSAINGYEGTANNQIAAHQVTYNNAHAQNIAAENTAANTYNTDVQGNTAGHATAVQNAEQAGAQGYQGLRGVLAAIGALGGTGQVLATRAVADSVNNDIGGADHNYQTNATALKSAHDAYLNAAAAGDTKLSNALISDNNASHATSYQDIINAARNLGDTATVQKYMPLLQQSTATPLQMAATPLTFNPAAVNAYAPNSGLTVGTQPTTAASAAAPVNNQLAVIKKLAG